MDWVDCVVCYLLLVFVSKDVNGKGLKYIIFKRVRRKRGCFVFVSIILMCD